MRDATRDLPALDIERVAEPACCPGGACGPIFETPLLELAFNRIRDFVRGRKATTIAAAGADPLRHQVPPAAPAVAAPPPGPGKDAPRA